MRVQFLPGARAVVAACSVLLLASASASGQSTQRAGGAGTASDTALGHRGAAPAPPAPTGPVRPLSVDEAVKLALEQNLGVQVERINPELQDLAIAQARTAWRPTLAAGMSAAVAGRPAQQLPLGRERQDFLDQHRRQTSPSASCCRGARAMRSATTRTASRPTTLFASFNPQLGANLDLAVVQPLLRGFRIDNARYQLMVSKKNREIADVDLQQTIALTVANVKNAYWDYKYALASLDVARQSFDLAQRVASQHAHARRDRHARANRRHRGRGRGRAARRGGHSGRSLDRADRGPAALADLRSRTRPTSGTCASSSTDPVPFQVQAVDLDAAIRRALAERTDLARRRSRSSVHGYTERFYKDQTLPGVDVRLDYNSTGLAGTQLVRGEGAFPPPVIGEIQKPVQRPAQRRVHQRVPDVALLGQRELSDRTEHGRRLARAHAARDAAVAARTCATWSCRSPRRCATPAAS